MNDAALEAVLRRDRLLIAASLLLLTMLAWAYVLWLAARMSMPPQEMAMPGMDAGAAMMPAIKAWDAADFLFSYAMWAVMMTGMMTPSAAPMILLYARVGRTARNEGKPFAATAWFASGYLLSWIGFSLLATVVQTVLTHAAMLTPMLASTSAIGGGIVLIAAGAYQWTSFKNVCLANCQSPLSFIQRHGGFKRDAAGSLALGVRHGLYCVGCCWALMTLLFVGGIMNVAWVAALAVLVLLEKILPAAWRFARLVGIALATAGILLLLHKGGL